MATFTGTAADETISTTFVSLTVTTSGDALPGAGDDIINAGGGIDTIKSGAGNDTVSGGSGNDNAFLGGGDDIFTWSPGDGSDSVEGGTGDDVLDFNGSNVGEIIAITANGTHGRLFRDVAAVNMDLNDIEQMTVHALGGGDTLSVADISGTAIKRIILNLEGALGSGIDDGLGDLVQISCTDASDIINVSAFGGAVKIDGLPWSVKMLSAGPGDRLEMNGGRGNDTISGAKIAFGSIGLRIFSGFGNDTLIGSVNSDLLMGENGRDKNIGGKGDDIAFMGAGNDSFVWGVGDGSDSVDGETEIDTIQLNGNGTDEDFAFFENAGSWDVEREKNTTILHATNVELLSLSAGKGNDNFGFGDLSGTGLTRVDLFLDGKRSLTELDTFSFRTADAGDTINLVSSQNSMRLTSSVLVLDVQGASTIGDFSLIGGSGVDVIDASKSLINFHLDIFGLSGSDTIVGSRFADLVSGGSGNDLANLGDGNDTFEWNPGDGSDVVNGQGGVDRLVFQGANVSEVMSLSAVGSRFRLDRDVAAISLDLDSLETVSISSFGGADTITINNLAGTAITRVNLDLAATAGGDGAADRVFLAGTASADIIAIASTAAGLSVSGLPWKISLTDNDAPDTISIRGGGGADTISSEGVNAGVNIQLSGGNGKDVLIGGFGNDSFVFESAPDGVNVDSIQKFNTVTDSILLDDGVFGGIGAVGTLSALAFHIGLTATTTDQRILYDSASGNLFFDADGSNGGAAILFADMAANLGLTQNDFTIF